nr:unnamed protein product [Spirometra erinaceieuropaei]
MLSLLIFRMPREILPKVERDALIELKADNDTVIAPADKGRSTVVLDGTDCLQKTKDLLEDRHFYAPCETNPGERLTRKINTTLLALENSSSITPIDQRMARAQEATLARFYGQNRADPKLWRTILCIRNVFGAFSRLPTPLGVGVAHRPAATIRCQVMRAKDPLPRPETSGVFYRIWCSCGKSNYVGETGRLHWTRIAEHAAAVRRNNASSQVAAHPMRPGRTFKFDHAEILEGGDDRESCELLELWLRGPQSISTPHSVLRHSLARAINHPGSKQADEPDGRATITPVAKTSDEISATNNLHADYQAIIAPADNSPR